MALYIFTVKEKDGVPDNRLLALIGGRVKYENVFFCPECASAGRDMALFLGAACTEKISLALKGENETEREYTVRIKKEGGTLAALNGNNILLLPPENVKILCGLKKTPPHGYSEVI